MSPASKVLHGTRILSLALNLPGPAALLRCRRFGATCVKIEPPSGDPMGHYDPAAYAELHEGIRVVTADLKSDEGRAVVHGELAKAHVLLTSFRPSAIAKLGLDWKALHARYPALSQVAIVGGAGEAAEAPGHDLTYLAEHGLVGGLELPATLFADMAGALLATEAVLQAALLQAERYAGGGDPHPQGRCFEVPLEGAAAWLATPRRWGLTQPSGSVGGAHAGYRVYACRDGRVAVAALEPHFARALCELAGIPFDGVATMLAPSTRDAIGAHLARMTRGELERVARERDIPLHTLPPLASHPLA